MPNNVAITVPARGTRAIMLPNFLFSLLKAAYSWKVGHLSSLLNTVEESDYFVTDEFRTAGCDWLEPVEKGMSIAGNDVFLIIR